MKIRSLTKAEIEFIQQAIELLFNSSASGSNPRWATNIMLSNDADFIKRLLLQEKSE